MKKPSVGIGMTDRQKVESWLDFIGEFDQSCRAEVLAHCKESTDARAYYVGRWETRSDLDKRPTQLSVPKHEPILTAKDRAAGEVI